MLELTFSSPFYKRKQHPNSLSHSAVSLSGDGSYCISYKTTKRAQVNITNTCSFCYFQYSGTLLASHPVPQLFVLLHEQVELLLEICQLHAESLGLCWLWPGSAEVKLYETVQQLAKVNQCTQRQRHHRITSVEHQLHAYRLGSPFKSNFFLRKCTVSVHNQPKAVFTVSTGQHFFLLHWDGCIILKTASKCFVSNLQQLANK